MDRPMNIDEFHKKLASGDEDTLMESLRELTHIEKPEDIVSLVEPTGITWTNWR